MSLLDRFFFPRQSGIGIAGMNEHRDKHILLSSDLMCSSYCSTVPVEHPDFLVCPLSLWNSIVWPKLMRYALF